MTELAPLEYIRDYYEGSLSKAELFPKEYGYYQSFLSHVKGASVLNVGCGPLFYEDLPHFGEVPRHYVGIDVNTNAFKFMEQSQHPRLAEGKKYVESHKIQTEFISESVFDWAAETDTRFDSVFGVGVFATFYGTEFHRLMHLFWRVLNKGGHLVNVSWDGTYYTDEQKRDKLKYRFNGPKGPTPGQLIDWVQKVGFKLMERRILTTDPQTYKWDSIHVSAFRKGQDPD
jgi:cyclopropane fatty-acyl-phospholipid synthase-like methyltransferase